MARAIGEREINPCRTVKVRTILGALAKRLSVVTDSRSTENPVRVELLESMILATPLPMSKRSSCLSGWPSFDRRAGGQRPQVRNEPWLSQGYTGTCTPRICSPSFRIPQPTSPAVPIVLVEQAKHRVLVSCERRRRFSRAWALGVLESTADYGTSLRTVDPFRSK